MPLEIYTDGGSRGNPGPAAAGVVIRDEQGRAILEAGYFLGKTTNNVAEYTAMVMALEAAQKWGAEEVSLFCDSELIVKQLTGEYQVKDAKMHDLFQQVQKLLLKFSGWQIQHVRRELNRRADALVNKALDRQADVIEVQLGDARPEQRAMAEADDPAQAKQARPGQPPRAVPGLTQTGALFPVVVRCITDPRQDACQAGMQQGLEFFFTDATPGGLCIHATKAVLDTVLAMQYAASQGERLAPVRVRCRLRGCGAEFEVRLAPDKAASE